MSAKNIDSHNRWRSKTVSFRATPEENEQIDLFARLAGMTKQDYIICRLLCRDVVVHGNSRVYKALRDQLTHMYEELRRIEKCGDITPEFIETMNLIGTILNGLKEENDA